MTSCLHNNYYGVNNILKDPKGLVSLKGRVGITVMSNVVAGTDIHVAICIICTFLRTHGRAWFALIRGVCALWFSC